MKNEIQDRNLIFKNVVLKVSLIWKTSFVSDDYSGMYNSQSQA